MKDSNGLAFASSLMILMAIAIGCSFGSTCRSELIVDGKSYVGTDSHSEQAEKNACNGYCIEGDPDFDAAYKQWLETPEAGKVADRNNKWAAYATDKKLNDMVVRCIARCKDLVTDGLYKLKTECK